jgi:hypothetical protein
LFTFWENICLLLIKLTRSIFGILNFNFLKYFLGIQNGLKTLKSICWPPVSLIDKRTLICDHIKNIWINELDCQSQCKVKWWSIDRMSDNFSLFYLDRALSDVWRISPWTNSSTSSSTGSTRISWSLFVFVRTNPDFFVSIFQVR